MGRLIVACLSQLYVSDVEAVEKCYACWVSQSGRGLESSRYGFRFNSMVID